jgi:hypothetical protein
VDNIFWLFGPAGTGKSTVAATFAKDLRVEPGRLGSFIAFDRSVVGRSDPSRAIRTMAYELARNNPQMAQGIMKAKNLARLIEGYLGPQFDELIKTPARKMNPATPLVIIIDALDEALHCDKGLEGHFLSVLQEGLPQLPKHIRVLITSRPNSKISDMLSHPKLPGDPPKVLKRDLSHSPDANKDIHQYISTKMVDNQRSKGLQKSWPGPGAITDLTKRAHGLFIWAAVVCSYISTSKPETAIKEILEDPEARAHAEQGLDNMYATALEGNDWDYHDYADAMREVLQALVAAKGPLSVESIANIPGAAQLVMDLHSRGVLRTDGDELIEVAHPSFCSYLTDPKRCGNKPWLIQIREEGVVAGSSET